MWNTKATPVPDFFKEHSDRGFESVAEYSPVRYTRYVDPIDGQPIVGRRPEKEDYVADPYATFVDMDIVRNSMKVEKKVWSTCCASRKSSSVHDGGDQRRIL